MKRHALSVSILTALCAAQAFPALSAEPTEQMVVTGTRTENLIANVPNTTEVFTAEDIQAIGAVSVFDVLTQASNVQINAQRGGINIRGLGFDYTVILVNGRKPGGLENIKDFQSLLVSTLDVNSIERIEVLRGQAGAMYGANAIGGVINIITKQSMEPSTRVATTVGNDITKFSVFHDFGQNGNWDGTFNGSFTDSRGIEEKSLTANNEGLYGTTNTADGYLGNVNTTIGYQVNDNNRVHVDLGAIVERSQTYSNNAPGRNPADRQLLTGALIWDGYTLEHSYSAGLAYNRTENNAVEGGDLFEDLVFDAQNAWEINDNNTLLFGGEVLITSADTQLPMNESLTNYAVYLQDEIRLFDERLLLIPSVRYDDNEAFGGKTTYQLGTTWEVIDDHRLKANVGIGYKAPTLMQLYGTEATSAGTFWGNEDLEAEESDNYELRYEYRGDRLNYAVGWYRNEITNYLHRELCTESSGNCDHIADIDYAAEEDYLRINLGNVEIEGIEAEIGYQLTEALSVTGRYSQIDAQSIASNGTVSQLTYTAEEIYGLDLAYHNTKHDFTANIWGNLNKDYLYSTTQGPFDFYNLNASVRKNFDDDYSLTVAAYNFLQSERDTANDAALNPMEWRATFEMKM